MTLAADPDLELIITRTFAAPRDLVFKVWTDPRHVKNWWGPTDYPAKHLEMDVRPGGTWRGCLVSNETGEELWQGGVFREVEAPERIVFTFAWDAKGERGLETLVTVTFAEQDGTVRSSQSRNATDIRAGGPAHSIALMTIWRRQKRAEGARRDERLR